MCLAERYPAGCNEREKAMIPDDASRWRILRSSYVLEHSLGGGRVRVARAPALSRQN